MFVICEHCVLSGRDLCVGLIITRPDESYRLCCVVVSESRNLANEDAMAHLCLLRRTERGKKRYLFPYNAPVFGQ